MIFISHPMYGNWYIFILLIGLVDRISSFISFILLYRYGLLITSRLYLFLIRILLNFIFLNLSYFSLLFLILFRLFLHLGLVLLYLGIYRFPIEVSSQQYYEIGSIILVNYFFMDLMNLFLYWINIVNLYFWLIYNKLMLSSVVARLKISFML